MKFLIPKDLTIEEYLSGVQSRLRNRSFYEIELSIKASLTTKEGFHKSVDIEKIEHIIRVPRMRHTNKVVFKITNHLNDSVIIESMDFYLVKYKYVKQKKGLHHIVAVYKEQ